VNAQKLASFENPENDLLEIGEKEYMAEIFVLAPAIADNDVKAGLNTTNRVFKAVNVADADWWGNFGSLKFKTPMLITENNRYLKFLAYRSIQPKEFRITINTGGAYEHEQDWQAYYGKLSEDGVWQGVVVDLGNWIGQEITSMVFVFSTNWYDPRTGWGVATYMFDEFELSDNPLPTGVTERIDLSGFNINFENTTVTNEWITQFDMLNEANSYEIVDNPETEGANRTPQAVKFDKSGEASWWQGFRMVFNGALKVSADNKYLHVMVKVPTEVFEEIAADEREYVDVQLCAKDFSGREENYVETIWDDQFEWMDIVMPLNSLTHVSELTVRFDILKDINTDEWINSPANTFYLDEITINDSPDPRTNIEAGIKINELPEVRIYSSANGIAVSGLEKGSLKVYSVVGVLVASAEVTGKTAISLPKGLYIAKAESESKTKLVKLIVR
jgi:hypothetical protein